MHHKEKGFSLQPYRSTFLIIMFAYETLWNCIKDIMADGGSMVVLANYIRYAYPVKDNSRRASAKAV